MRVHYIQLGMFVSHGLRLRRYIGTSLVLVIDLRFGYCGV